MMKRLFWLALLSPLLALGQSTNGGNAYVPGPPYSQTGTPSNGQCLIWNAATKSYTNSSSCSGGGGSSVTNVATGAGLTGGPITSTGTISQTALINAQTGTSYTVQATDAFTLLTFNNSAAIAVSLPAASTTGFGVGFSFEVQDLGVGTVTITPASGTINGAASVAIPQNSGCSITSDGTNYQISACSAVSTPIPNGTILGNNSGSMAAPSALTALPNTVQGTASCINPVESPYLADPTGVSDSTSAFQSALTDIAASTTKKKLCVPSGTFLISSNTVATPALSFVNVSNVSIECQSRDSTTINFSDTTNANDLLAISGTSGGITVRNCRFVRSQAATAGSIIHVTDAYFIRIEDNQFSTNAWNDVTVDCSTNSPSQIYISGNQFGHPLNDGVYANCTNSSLSVGDLFIEPGQGQRNYFSAAGRAAIELNGEVNGAFINLNVIFNNSTGIIANSQGLGAPGIGLSSNTIDDNDIDTNTTSATFTSLASTKFNNNHIFSGMVTCNSCQNISVVGNHYEGTTAGLTLNGVNAWSDSGSHWSGMTIPVTVGPSGGGTASNYVYITGAQYVNASGAFLNSSGASNPSTNVFAQFQTGSGASCLAGANWPFHVAGAPILICNGLQIYGNSAIVNTGDQSSIVLSTAGTVSETIYNPSSGAGAQACRYFGNNTASAEASICLKNSGATKPNGFVFNGLAGLNLQGNSNDGIGVDTSGNGLVYQALISNTANSAPTGCSISAHTTKLLAGQYTSGTTGTCTVTVTLPAVASGHTAYSCYANDTTTKADAQNASTSGNTLTVSGTTVSGDVIQWGCPFEY